VNTASKVMVTGSRTWGVCPHEPPHAGEDGTAAASTCPVVHRHRAIMLDAVLEHRLDQTGTVQLIHGDAVGADRMAVAIWSLYGLGPITGFPYVKELGKAGGPARNGIMVAHMPDLVLAFHLGNSRGTADAVRQARAAGLSVHVYPREGL
jgi:hypothetical protein